MKILVEWLKDFVELEAGPEKLAEDLHMAGVAVEGLEPAPGGAGTVLELEITTNRPDLLSHYGVAREVAALYGLPLKPFEPKPKSSGEPVEGKAAIEIREPELCHRFTGMVLRGVRAGSSPKWMQQRLEACGVQSINNVVDVSNYVMLEMGHPNHAYDLATLRGGQIIVRRATDGELLRTLDGVNRTLKSSHLVIADAERAIGLGGIMGGENTEISSMTKDVLLEAAWFDPVTTRRGARALGLRTEASYRFERGMDVEAPPKCLARCAELIQELAGGELLAGSIDVYPTRWQHPRVPLRRSELSRHLGAAVPDADVERILQPLGFEYRSAEEGWMVTVPGWRRDAFREIDVIEEVARLYGYDRFPSRVPSRQMPVALPSYRGTQRALRERLEAQGFDEAVSLSLVNPDEASHFLTPGDEPAPITNPLSRENSVLRPSGLVSHVGALVYNLNRGEKDVRLYEMGKAYTVRQGRWSERRILTLSATGAWRAKSAHEEREPFGFFHLKGVLENLLEAMDLPAVKFQPGAAAWLDPGLQTELVADGRLLGTAGRLSEKTAQAFKLRQEAWLAELDLEALLEAGLRRFAYRPVSRFPTVERDFSLLLKNQVAFATVRETVEGLRIPELTGVEVLDRFEGKSLPAGHYSLLVRVRFQSGERTLEESEIQRFTERILQSLAERTGASLRS